MEGYLEHTGIKLNTMCLHSCISSWYFTCMMFICVFFLYFSYFVQPGMVSWMVIFLSLVKFVYHCSVFSASCGNYIGMDIQAGHVEENIYLMFVFSVHIN